MLIRKSGFDDLDQINSIYEKAREFMRESGNLNQWTNGHPSRETANLDILEEKSYVCIHEDKIAAVFYFAIEDDPTYAEIDGMWLNDLPYGVVHRIARARDVRVVDKETGENISIGAYCLNWAFSRCTNLRIDTHEDNAPMRRLLDKLGFEYCGIIKLQNGDDRMAFQKGERK